MVFDVNCILGEHEGFSCKVSVGDRVYFIKLFVNGQTQFFSCDIAGNIEKEISKAEFDLWLGIMADNEEEIKQIQDKISRARKY